MKKKYIIITISLIAAAGFGVWFFTKSIGEDGEVNGVKGIIWPLKYGSGRNAAENPAVRRLQTWLNTKISIVTALLVVDGIFGSLTQAALIEVTGGKIIHKAEFELI